ncbi:MAG: phage tail tube protein [Beijerinckiaceae bacterium]|nr:phage tail tube protein [Beijerinckiaceae bacterium]
MTSVSIGYGSTYAIWDASLSVPAFVELEEVISITPGEAETDRVEATHMSSPGRRREYVAGLIDSGEASVEINWVPGSDTDLLLRALHASGETAQHRITLPANADGDRVTLTYDAQLLSYNKSLPIDDRMTATVTISVSGEETWGVAA